VSTQTRKYELKARAERQRETRDRIAAAASGLHEEVGVANTTVADIARRAGVTRLTVYNHFADLSELLPACAAHYAARHPGPDFAAALALENPTERLRSALKDLYGWYRETEPMLSKVHSDRVSVPELDEFMRANRDPAIAELAAALVSGFGVRARRAERLRALVALALDFGTWRRLTEEGLDDAQAAELMTSATAAGLGLRATA
jgi:AcrR family transcriptional regulator